MYFIFLNEYVVFRGGWFPPFYFRPPAFWRGVMPYYGGWCPPFYFRPPARVTGAFGYSDTRIVFAHEYPNRTG